MVLELGRVHAVLGVVSWVLVEVGHEDRLRVRGLDVFSGAAVSVSAGADFLIETQKLVELTCWTESR